MLTADDAAILLDFLDRAPITGHKERNNMTFLVKKITDMGLSTIKPHMQGAALTKVNSESWEEAFRTANVEEIGVKLDENS